LAFHFVPFCFTCGDAKAEWRAHRTEGAPSGAPDRQWIIVYMGLLCKRVSIRLFRWSGSEAEGVGEEVKKSETIAVARRGMLKK
jgi:hypothetical protein